ncbi:nitrilase-related carbon-nitrogen hydrolase [Photobacterium lutimaris]|uniref:NAD+ synthetase n=1 Tax=Photobacterium lutimaris TaxID=388278 RepID=A0A2T3IXJ6_9GAMM|nr:nitrilase-related carbon-nitrogen hydrolase [Photobacterium lutimaris]PSU33254.1 NAD+ synthetase [Photobacterium lutimaris]TDR75160.1 putative amidohydrolase [Photobacterium lutimaris]
MTKEVLHVGIAQIAPVLGDVEANLQKHLNYIKQARELGVEVLLFPELSLTGYSLREKTLGVAMGTDHPLLKQLADAAGDMIVSAGFIEEAQAGEFYNAQAMVTDGRVLHVHRKMNLPNYGGLEEAKWYSKGQALEPCEAIAGWPMHTLICADLWNPALPHLAMLDKPALMLAPVNSAADIVSDEFSNPQGWKTNTDFISMTYGVPVMMANSCALEGNSRFWGGSRILDAFGHCLVEAGGEEALISATVSIKDTREARFQLPTIRDADSRLVLDLLAKRIGK